MNVAQLLEGRRVCVCAGAGGVGKTTSSAAIALGMAERGLKVAVLTIDPARRLANSLGLQELGNEARMVDPERLRGAGIEPRGELWAMMLDPKRTFDALVGRYAADAEARDRILENPIYAQISNAVAGSQEYMAMERLYELHQERRFDLLVLDTPPSRNALDFLEAPERLGRFIDSRALQLFLAPSRTGLKLLGRGTGVFMAVLGRVTGADLLRDLSEFFGAFAEMAEGFRERAARVRELLGDPGTTFLVVTSPRRDAIDEALFFRRRLDEAGMPFGGAIVNRVLEQPPEADAALERELAQLLGGDEALARKVARNAADLRGLAVRHHERIALLERELGGRPVLRVPHLAGDVHDLAGLAGMNRWLFAEEGARAGRRPGRRRFVAQTGAE